MSADRVLRGHELDREAVLGLARREAEPAVTILMPVEQPVAAHPESPLRLRALVERALGTVESWWGTERADQVRVHLDRSDCGVGSTGETARGLAVLATPDDCTVLRLPFAVEEQVVVDRTFGTRQLFEGLARNPRFRVLVLDGHHAMLFLGQGQDLVEVKGSGFPLEVEPPHEWDTPKRDLPIHEEAESEEHRVVYREVDAALDAAGRSDPLPTVVAGPERELAHFERVTRHGELVAGRVHGNFAHSGISDLAAAVQPAIEAYREEREAAVVDQVREAYGRERAVAGIPEVHKAAEEGRGHLLVVEEGLTFPRHWVDGLSGGSGPDEQLDFDDLVDDVIEAVLLAGGDVEFVHDGALGDLDRIGLVLRF